MNNSKIFNSIEQINNIIYNYCLNELLDKSDVGHNLYYKIRNLTLLLQNNASRIVMKKSQLFSRDLSLEEIKDLCMKIYEIMTKFSGDEIENNITQLIKNYSLNLDELWVDDMSESKEYQEIRNILRNAL